MIGAAFEQRCFHSSATLLDLLGLVGKKTARSVPALRQTSGTKRKADSTAPVDNLELGDALGAAIRTNPIDWLDERSRGRFDREPVYERSFRSGLVRSARTVASLRALVHNRVLCGVDLGVKDALFAIVARFDVERSVFDQRLRAALALPAETPLVDTLKVDGDVAVRVLEQLPLITLVRRLNSASARSTPSASASAAARRRAAERGERSSELTAGAGLRLDSLRELWHYIEAESTNDAMTPFLNDCAVNTTNVHGLVHLRQRQRFVQLAANVLRDAAHELLTASGSKMTRKQAAKRVLLFVGKPIFGNGQSRT